MPRKGWRKDNPKNQRMRMRVRPDELEAIRQQAADADMTVSAFVRDRMINGKVIKRKGPPSVFDDEQMDELRDVGDEINELAKASNRGDDVDETVLRDAVARLRALLAEVTIE